MEPDPKIQRHAFNNAWLASLAHAAGLELATQDYLERMLRAWALLKPADFDGDGASGAKSFIET